MSALVILSTLLVAVAGLFLMPTLWRAPAAGADAAAKVPALTTQPHRLAALGLLALLAVATGGLYALVGDPRGLDAVAAAPAAEAEARAEPPPPISPDAPPTAAQIEGMVNRLAQRLQAQPNDPDGWRRLIRSYETLGRFEQAADAYRQLMALQPPSADLLTDYAVALGMSKGQTLVGEPEGVINEALKLDPRHVQALALSGSAAFEGADYGRAVAQWKKLLAVIPTDSEMRTSIERNVAKAEGLSKAK